MNRNVSVSWQPPTVNSDGSTLTDLAGYKILWGAQSGQYTASVAISNPGLVRYVIESLPPGKYFFAMVAVNSVGNESDASPEVAATIG